MNEAVAKALEAAKTHPGRGTARRQMVFVAVLLGGAVALAWIAPLVSVSLAAMGAIFGWAAWDILRGVTQMAFLNPAYAAATRGDHEVANALLETAAARRPEARARRAIASVRAMLALDRADAKAVVEHTSAVIDVPPGIMVRDLDQMQRGIAYSMRALALATLRDDAAALADADRACTDRFASPTAIGQAELARALVAANAQKKDEVRAILTRAAPFFDSLGGRQRELAKRLSRYAAAPKRSIYRHAAKPAEEGVEAWLSQPSATKTEALPATDARVAAPAVQKPRGPSKPLLTLALWALLILMFLAMWQVLNPQDPGKPIEPGPPLDVLRTISWVFLGTTVALYGIVARNLFVASRKRTTRLRASILALRGDAKGLQVLEEQEAAGFPDASMLLAGIAEREGRFEDAIKHCELGIGFANATEVSRLRTHDLTAPALFAERAFCYAALGKSDEANAILAAMPNASGYALAPTARLRVQLAQASVRGDHAGALEIAHTRGEALPLATRDAFLIDLLEATHGRGADDEEWSRLNAELAADPKLAKWIEHFMPQGTIKRRVVVLEPEPEPLEGDLDREHSEAVEQ